MPCLTAFGATVFTDPWYLPHLAAATPRTTITRDLIVGLSAIATAVVAILGINAWRRQLKGTTEYTLALKVLRAVYDVRESMLEARSRIIMPSEPPQALDGSEEAKAIARCRAYEQRLARVREARSKLQLGQQEALAAWGEPAKDALHDLFEAINDLLVTCDLYFEEELALGRRADRDGKKEERDADNLAMKRVLYSGSGPDDKDPFGERIARAVTKAEEFYRLELK